MKNSTKMKKLLGMLICLGMLVQYVPTVEAAQESSEKYTVVVSSCENGTVSASLTEATEGTSITLHAVPASGYEVGMIIVTNLADTTQVITATKQADDTYTFTMPAAMVSVKAIFVLHTHSFDTSGKCSTCNTQAVASLTSDSNVTYYASLPDAIEQAQQQNSSTVTILTDITLADRIHITAGTFTIDLGGKQVTHTALDPYIADPTFYVSGANSNVTFDNGTILSTGTCIYVYNGNVNVRKVNLTSQGSEAILAHPSGYPKAQVIVDGATVNGSIFSYWAANIQITNSSINAGSGYDIGAYNGTLTVGINVSFPDGLQSDIAVNTMLTEGMSYWQDNKMIVLTEGQTEITGGDVTVKATCTHEGHSTSINTDGTHTINCTQCGNSITETHTSDTNGNCACGFQFPICATDEDASSTHYFADLGTAVTQGYSYVQLLADITVSSAVTVPSGVLLTCAPTANGPEFDITFTDTGSLTNNGTVVLKSSYTYSTIPTQISNGTVTIGGKSYTWDNESEKYVCTDGNHTYDATTGLCVCGGTCIHEGYTNGKCDTCGYVCPHETYDNGFCTVCGSYQPAVLNGNVYEFSNAGQLYWFAQQVNTDNTTFGNANAVLTANIVVNQGAMTAESTNTRGWIPIGNDVNAYSGIFDGAEHTVSGLYFNDANAWYVGLFGYVNGGTVKNVGVTNSYFYGELCVGGIVGSAVKSTVTNCYNISTVSGSSNYVGGVVGSAGKSTVTNCYNTGTVSGSNMVGGVVGYEVNGSTVSNCYNTGTVSGSDDVGGIVGFAGGSTVSNCYNTGTVSGSSNVGGLVGYKVGNSAVTNCYYLTSSDTVDEEGSTAAKTSDQFASGEVAYLLNGDQSVITFQQTIGTDSYPGFTGGTVYRNINCKNEVSYANGKTVDYAHVWADGACTVCSTPCSHTYTYAKGADGTSIVESCTVCGSETGKLTINTPEQPTVYDGTRKINSLTTNGFKGVNPQDITVTMTRDNQELVGAVPVTAAGKYTITATVKDVTAEATFTISPKELTPKLSGSVSKVYDGTTEVLDDLGLAITLDGVISGADLSVTADYAYESANAGETTVIASNITLSGTSARNYTLTPTTATAEVGIIKARDISSAEITPGTALTYNGKQQTQTVTDVRIDDMTVTYTVSGNTGINVADYTLTVTGIGNFKGTATADWSIAKAEPQIVWKSGNSNTYGKNMYITAYINGVDGNLLPGTAIATVFDTKGAKLSNVTCTLADSTGVYYYNWLNALSDGTCLPVGSYVVKLTYQGNANYNAKTAELVTYTISKADPEIGTVGCEMALFDSTAASDVELTRTDKTIAGTLALTDSELTTGEGTYHWKFTPKDTDNYNIITGTVVLNVTADVPEKLEVSGTLEKDSYSYGDTFSMDGLTITATCTSGATKDVTGLVSFDGTLSVGQTSVILTCQGKTCEVTGITVVKKQLDVSGMALAVPENAVYNGTAYTATLKGELPAGVMATLSGDKETNAGSYTAKAVFSLAEGYSADNYEIVNGADLTATWSIGKAKAEITAKDQTITYGKSISNTEISSVGLVDGHSVTVTLTPGTANVTANSTITASTAVITADGIDVTDNYSVSYAPGKLVIQPDTSKIDGLTTGNVTSANAADIEAVQEMLYAAETDGADAETLAAWAAISTKCEELIKKIKENMAENSQSADNVTDTVEPDDEEASENIPVVFSSPATGDASNIILWFAGLCISALSLVALLIGSKKTCFK